MMFAVGCKTGGGFGRAGVHVDPQPGVAAFNGEELATPLAATILAWQSVILGATEVPSRANARGNEQYARDGAWWVGGDEPPMHLLCTFWQVA